MYNNILVAVDLRDEAEAIVSKAKQLAESTGASLNLIHVVDPVPMGYGTGVPMYYSEIQDELQKQAKEQLNVLGEAHGIKLENRILAIGQPKTEIHKAAAEKNADCVVIGSHNRDGLALILGSTANSVLHGSKCDVLTVHID